MENPKGCWRVCIGATLAMFVIVGLNLNCFSIYVPYLKEQCSLTYTQSSLMLLLRNFLGMFSLVFVTKYYEKLEMRRGVMVAFLLAIGGHLLYARAENFWDLCLAGICSGFAYGLGGAYPASILMHRWFRSHLGMAIGLSSASSGIAMTVCAPVITALIEKYSVRTAMLIEAAFFAAAMIVCFVLIRNWPAGHRPAVTEQGQPVKRPRLKLTVMIPAALFIGLMGDPGFQNISMLSTSRGFAPFQVAFLASLTGAGLMISKFMLGELADRWGAYRTNWLFFGMTITGCAMSFFPGSYGWAIVAVALFSLGAAAISTVGLAISAKDLNPSEDFPQAMRQYQFCYLFGGFVGGAVPGALADWTGNYGTFYGILALLGVAALVIVQSRYRKLGKG